MKLTSNVFSVLLDPFLGQARAHLHDKTFLRGLERAQDTLIEAVSGFKMRQAAISSDLDLTPQAQDRIIAEAREAAIARVDAVGDLSAREQQLRAKAFASGPEKSEVAQVLDFLKHQEIRRSIAELDALALETRLLRALSDGEDDLIAAVLQSPVPLLSQEKLEGLAEQRTMSKLERENPDLLNEIRDVGLINGLVRGMKNTTKSHLRQ